MARQRYISTSPTFSNDFMYQAPWELALGALQFNEQQVDTIFDQAQILGDASANVNFLEADRGNVEAERQIFDSQITEITEALSADPTQWKKQMPRIRQVSQELQNNLRTGNLSRIQSSYNAYQNFVENYKDLRKNDPQEFDRVAQFYMNQWRNSNERGSIDSIFNPGAVYAPKALTDKEFVDILKDFKADESTVLDGLYKIDNKVVTRDQVAQTAINLAISNPDFSNFIGQRQMIGDESYSSPIYISVDTNTGQVLSPEELQERQEAFSSRALQIEEIFSDPNKLAQLSEQQIEEMKAELNPSFATMLNPRNAIAQQANALGNVYGFTSQNITANQPALAMYREGQANARNAANIADRQARQDSQQEHAKEMQERGHEQQKERIALSAELKPQTGTTRRSSRANANTRVEEPLTTSGNSFFPTWGTTMSEDRSILSGNVGSQYERMIVGAKVNTMADASSRAALNKTSNRNDRDVRSIIEFVSNGIKNNKGQISELVEAQDIEGLTELYLQEFYPEEAEKKGNKLSAFFQAMGKAGSPGAPVRDAVTPELDSYQEASNNFDTLFNKVKGALDTFTKDYSARNETLREPKAEVDYFGLNTRSPEVREFQNNMNINIGDYKFYRTDNLLEPVENVSDVRLKNITGSYGGMPVGYIVEDPKGTSLKAVPNSNRAQNDLDFISRNSSKMVIPADTAKTNLYFGNGGKNANLASAFDYTASVGDIKQVIPISTNTGKPVNVTKEIVDVQGEQKLKISISYQGAQPIEAIVDPGTVSDINQNSAIIQMLDRISKENNFNYFLR